MGFSDRWRPSSRAAGPFARLPPAQQAELRALVSARSLPAIEPVLDLLALAVMREGPGDWATYQPSKDDLERLTELLERWVLAGSG